LSTDPLNDQAARFKTAFAGVVDISAVFVGTDGSQFREALKALADSDDPTTLLLTSADPAMVQLRERALVASGLYNDQIENMVSESFGVEPKKLRRLADRDPALIPVIGGGG
jgi:hypothetical protein